MTDAAISPDGTMLLVKTGTVVYAYNLSGTTVAGALGLRAVHRGHGTEERRTLAGARRSWRETTAGFVHRRRGHQDRSTADCPPAVWSFTV